MNYTKNWGKSVERYKAFWQGDVYKRQAQKSRRTGFSDSNTSVLKFSAVMFVTDIMFTPFFIFCFSGFIVTFICGSFRDDVTKLIVFL